jgi:hypothetical protein
MRLIGVDEDKAQLELSYNEALVLNNALNEVCNGIDIDNEEFQTRIGVDREDASSLLQEVRGVLKRMEETERTSEAYFGGA